MENIKFTPFAIRKIYHSREIEIIVTIYLKYYTFMHISAIIYPATLTRIELYIYIYIHVFMYAMTRSWLGDDIHIAAVVTDVYTFRYKHGDMCTYENMKRTIMLIDAITSGLRIWLSN